MDRPYIPGSTFKGVLRSWIESLVRAVVPHRRGACIPTQEDERCIRRGSYRKVDEQYALNDPIAIEDLRRMAEEDEKQAKEEAQKKNQRVYKKADEFLAKYVAEHSCLVCQTFGSPWLASHVQVKDLQVDPTIWFGQYQVRDGVAIDRDTETAAEGLLYDYEVIPSDVRFELEVLVENAELWQLGMLVLGLKPFERGEIALGGFRSRGLGSVRLDWRGTYFEMKPGDADVLVAYLQGKVAGEDARAREEEWIEAFQKKLRDRAQGRD